MREPLHGVVVAPAGFGKTHRITELLARGERSLVLTHTNVAVANLKRRSSWRGMHRIETIDSFARRLALSFRTISGVEADSTDWATIRAGAEAILTRHAIQSALKNSYSQVLVDEFQDCSSDQTTLVHRLASFLPTGVFGDPMQAIYDSMKGEVLQDWTAKIAPWDVCEHLTDPWRWKAVPEQGVWVMAAREALEANRAVRLAGRNSLRLEANPHGAFLSSLLSSRSGTWAIIHGDAGNPHTGPAISKAHRFNSAELAEISFPPELEAFAASWDTGATASAILSAAKSCFSGTSKVTSFSTCLKNALAKKPTRGATRLAELIREFETADPASTAMSILEWLSKHKETYLYRPDLISRIRRALGVVRSDSGLSMADAVRRVQDQIRAGAVHTPKGPVVGSVLRLKGLEFDHVVIVRPESFTDAREVYVAVSRAKQTVTVITKSGARLRWFTT